MVSYRPPQTYSFFASHPVYCSACFATYHEKKKPSNLQDMFENQDTPLLPCLLSRCWAFLWLWLVLISNCSPTSSQLSNVIEVIISESYLIAIHLLWTRGAMNLYRNDPGKVLVMHNTICLCSCQLTTMWIPAPSQLHTSYMYMYCAIRYSVLRWPCKILLGIAETTVLWLQ